MRPVLFLYNIILIITAPFAFVAGSIINKLKWGEKGFGQRFGLIKLKQSPRSKSLWFHCASVGEVRSIEGLVSSIRQKYPDTAIIVSTMTSTGRQTAVDFIKADEAFLLPIENGSAIAYLIKLLGVKAFFIVDTEIWPNLIFTAGSHTRLIMINGKISEKTFKTYMRFKFFFTPLFKKFAAILTKSQDDFSRFVKIAGTDKNIAPLGNIKFQKRKDKSTVAPIKELEGIKYALAASTHSPEEDIFLDAFKEGGSKYEKLIIAPRHINRAQDIKQLAISKGFTACLLSEGTNAQVVVTDRFGLLESLYLNASKIFIGGSIAPIGGHNIFEALQFEKTVAVGQNMNDFAEIYLPAKECGVIHTVNNAQDIACWLQTPETGGNFQEFFRIIDENNHKTINTIEELINDVLAC